MVLPVTVLYMYETLFDKSASQTGDFMRDECLPWWPMQSLGRLPFSSRHSRLRQMRRLAVPST